MRRYSGLRGRGLLFLSFLWFLWFFNFTARSIFSPILPLIEDEFVISHSRATSIFLFFSIGYGIAVLASGFCSGRFGYKKSILFSLSTSAFTCFLIPFTKAFSSLYVFNLVLGFSVGAYLPAAIPLICECFAEKDWGKSIAIHDAGAPVAIFSTPLVAVFLLHFMDWRGIFEVFAVIFGASAIAFYFTCDEVEIGRTERIALGNILKSPALLTVSTVFAFVAGANMGIYSIAPLYLTKELSLNIGYANAVLGTSRLGAIFVSIACGFLIDRFNLRIFLFTMTLISGILTVLTGMVSARFVGIALFLQAIFMTAFFPVALVSIARLFQGEARSMATGLVLAASVIFGAGLTPYLLGVAGDYLSFKVGIMLLGAGVSLSSLCVLSLKEIR